MTNTEKRSLYENIMKDVAKTVKSHLNESDEQNYSNLGEKNRRLAKNFIEMHRKDFHNPEANSHFANMFKDNLIISKNGKRIGAKVRIGLYNYNAENNKNNTNLKFLGEQVLYADSFGKLIDAIIALNYSFRKANINVGSIDNTKRIIIIPSYMQLWNVVQEFAKQMPDDQAEYEFRKVKKNIYKEMFEVKFYTEKDVIDFVDEMIEDNLFYYL